MPYQIKRLDNKDVKHFKELLEVFGNAFEDLDTYQNKIPSDEYLTNFLSKSHNIVLASLDDDKVIGGLVAYELEKFEQERKEIYIYDLAVSELHRRKGVATSLINELKSVAVAQHAYIIYVQADVGDLPAIKLYESLGVKENVLHFDIPVTE